MSSQAGALRRVVAADDASVSVEVTMVVVTAPAASLTVNEAVHVTVVLVAAIFAAESRLHLSSVPDARVVQERPVVLSEPVLLSVPVKVQVAGPSL